MKTQNNKPNYINLIKNVARLGAGSALLIAHIALLGGCALVAKHVEKKKKLKNAQKALTYEN